MKKLVTAIVAIAMGMVANAATYQWSYDGYLNNGDGSYGAINDTTAYLFNAGNVSQIDIVNGYNAAGGSFDLSSFAYVSTSSATVDGVAMSDTFTDAGTSDWTAYFALIDNGNLYISSEATASYAAVGTSTIGFSDQDDLSNATFAANSTYAGGGWYTATAVPEPTSGLLMLLGMAGLALRRKRA